MMMNGTGSMVGVCSSTRATRAAAKSVSSRVYGSSQ